MSKQKLLYLQISNLSQLCICIEFPRCKLPLNHKIHAKFQVHNISLGQDGLTPNQGVFVEEVEITAPQGAPVVFPCRCWLAEDEDDGQTTRVLVPGQSLTSRYDSKNVVKLNTRYIHDKLYIR